MTPDADERQRLNLAMDHYAEGDDDAFADVYDLLAPRLLRFFARQIGDRVRAEDLVQQTLLQMHAARRSYATGSDVVPWAFAIGRNVLIDARRRGRREVLFVSAAEDSAAQGAAIERESVPEGLASAREMAILVDEELARVPPARRAAYDLVRHEGLTVAQAAEVLGTTPTAVKLRLHRVYEALRGALGIGQRAVSQ